MIIVSRGFSGKQHLARVTARGDHVSKLSKRRSILTIHA